MAASASGLFTRHVSLFFLTLVAVNEVVIGGRRVRNNAVQLTNTEQANQKVASLSTACVSGDWCPELNGWYHNRWSDNNTKRECCKDGAFITHKYVDNSARCQGPIWGSIGQRECCTTRWAYCESDVEEQYCKGDRWMPATNDVMETANTECCNTNLDYKPEVKCYKGWTMSSCTGKYKYLGHDKCCKIDTCIKLEGSNGVYCKKYGWDDKGEGQCCTSENLHCEEDVSLASCSSNGWKYFGNRKCCTTLSHQENVHCKQDLLPATCSSEGWKYYLDNKMCCTMIPQEAQCTEGSEPDCIGAGYQYLGNNLCCSMTPEEASPLTCQKVDAESRCGAPWKYLGEGNCCTTGYANCVVALPKNCNGDGWMFLGDGDGQGVKCCTTLVYRKSDVKCHSGYTQAECQYKYLGSNKCCEIKGEYCVSLQRVSDGVLCQNQEKNGWKYTDTGMCCTTTSDEKTIKCADGYTFQNCNGKNAYMGSGKCCWEEKYFDTLRLSE